MPVILVALFYWLFLHVHVTQCARSPIDAISEDLTQVKEALASVQASLLTSVRLIQDQLEQYGKIELSRVDSRLTIMEQKLATLSEDATHIREKSRVWDNFQHHMKAWADLMTSIDSKIDHLARSHTEQMSSVSSQLGSFQTNLGLGFGQVSERLETLESRSPAISSSDPTAEFTARGVLSTLQSVDDKLSALMARPRLRHAIMTQRQQQHHQRTHSSVNNPPTSSCQSDIGEATREISAKIEDVMERVDNVKEVCRSRHGVSLDEDHYYEEEETGVPSLMSNMITTSEEQLLKLFQRASAPLGEAAAARSADIDRKFGDFFNITMDMFEHQHGQTESLAAATAASRQCCSGVAADVSQWRAEAAPVLSRLDRAVAAASAAASAAADRQREQMRFDVNRILSAMAEQRECKSKIREPQSVTPAVTNERDRHVLNDREALVDVVAEEKFPAHDGDAEVTGTGSEEEVEEDLMLRGCEDLLNGGLHDTKVYEVAADATANPKGRAYNQRLCELNTAGGGWTVILNRGDYGEPRTNFSLGWFHYKHGFGDFYGEFWFGNDFIHRLTFEQPMSLRVELTDFDGDFAYAEYSTFRVENEAHGYRLWVDGYSGNASDSLGAHNGYPFSTYDQNNDAAPKCCPCAPAYGGGWWFYSCFESNLNGEYHVDPRDNDYFRGIIWELWRGDYSLRSARMMVRPKHLTGGKSKTVADP